MNAVMKYPGSKWSLAKWIISFFPEHHSYLEPFFGSGAVLFNKPRSNIETVNDMDGNVVNLFEWIKRDPERLAHEIYYTPYARQVYEDAFASVPDDSLERAVNFYIRLNMGHGYRTNGKKVGWKNDVQGRERAYAAQDWCNLPDKILQAAERLRGVQIENMSALDLIKRFNYKNVLIYCDPPYMLETRGGGASTGIEMATGKSVDIAINHDPEAIRMHKTNHPHTRHYCENVWEVDPVEACGGYPVGLAWFSPDCKHFSKAKGGKPVEKKIRGLAWIVLKWAALVRPRVIMLENVEEFQTWGPCIPVRDTKTGRVIVNMEDRKKNRTSTRIAEPGEVVPAERQIFRPDPKRKGQTYRQWKKQLEDLGYNIETKELAAADYGAPTMRKRFFLIARCDGRPIVWPEPTHAPRNSEAVQTGRLKPYVGAYTQIDFTRPCPSIFDTAEEIKKKYGIRAVRPLAPKTMERIARGLKKFVLDNAEPFVVQVNHSGSRADYCNSMDDPLRVITSKHGFGIVEPYMVQIGQTGFVKDRSRSVEDPLNTVVSKNEHCLVNIQTVPYMGTNTTNHPGGSYEDPLHTVTTGNQQCLISPTLIQYHSETSDSEVRGQRITDPIMTLDGANRYGLVTSFLHKYYDGDYKDAGNMVENPLSTVTAGGGHFGEVRAFLVKYYGESNAQDIEEPLDTITSHDRFGLVTINGTDYQIVDIGLRMLEPEELYGCQGFPADYIIDRDFTGKKYPRSEQVKRCGNAVCPPIPAALVRANLPELCVGERMPNLSMEKVKMDQGQQLCFV